MSKVHRATQPPPQRTSQRTRSKSAQSTTAGAPVDAPATFTIDGRTIQQQALAVTSSVSKSVISRMLSTKPGKSRKDPKLSTLRKIQNGLEKITGQRYTLDVIGELITSKAA